MMGIFDRAYRAERIVIGVMAIVIGLWLKQDTDMDLLIIPLGLITFGVVINLALEIQDRNCWG